MGRLTLMELAERGELSPATELGAYWDAFCDADPAPDDFIDRMEAAGLVVLEGVTDEDLDDAFAAERGIEPGGMIYRLTPAGRAALQTQGDGK